MVPSTTPAGAPRPQSMRGTVQRGASRRRTSYHRGESCVVGGVCRWPGAPTFSSLPNVRDTRPPSVTTPPAGLLGRPWTVPRRLGRAWGWEATYESIRFTPNTHPHTPRRRRRRHGSPPPPTLSPFLFLFLFLFLFTILPEPRTTTLRTPTRNSAAESGDCQGDQPGDQRG